MSIKCSFPFFMVVRTVFALPGKSFVKHSFLTGHSSSDSFMNS